MIRVFSSNFSNCGSVEIPVHEPCSRPSGITDEGLEPPVQSQRYSMIPKKPALGLDPGVGTGFRKRSCSNNTIERDDDSKKNHRALGHWPSLLARTNSLCP